jgi:ubiquitin carboxyl-terminal hydrolase 4/11/15
MKGLTPKLIDSLAPVRGGNSTYLRDSFQSPSTWPNSASTGSVPTNGTLRPAGDVGLSNLGNTCFMNSGLQCLLHTASLAEYFLKRSVIATPHAKFNIWRIMLVFQYCSKGSHACHFHSPPMGSPNGGQSLMLEFQVVMQHAWFGTNSTLSISDFRNKLGEIQPQFKDGRQVNKTSAFSTLL